MRTAARVERAGLGFGVLFCAVMALSGSGYAQEIKSPDNIWRILDQVPPQRARLEPHIRPERFLPVLLDEAWLLRELGRTPLESNNPLKISDSIITLPIPDGTFQRFRIVESPVMAPGLQAQFPEIRTYVGQGIDDPAATLRFDFTLFGFHAQILSPNGAVYIDPYSRGDFELYACYYKRDYYPADAEELKCLYEVKADAARDETPGKGDFDLLRSGPTLRTYRLALTCTGEYAQAATGVTTPTVAQTLAAMTTTANRVTGIYETELAVRLTLITSNTLLVFTNPATDPYTANNNGIALLGQCQTQIDMIIGNPNYDIGHIFSTGGGGVAIPGVCVMGNKAQGVTGRAMPVGDPFDVDFVAHEMGHQFNANHTWNGNQGGCVASQHQPTVNYEPGSGTTILAYIGICGTDDLEITPGTRQRNSDPYMHSGSFDEITQYVTTGNGAGCAVTSATGNLAPVAGAGPDFTIPRNTPFTLTATGTDPNGDPLTFCWEQRDNMGPQRPITAPDDGQIPLFRSFLPTTNPTRTFPRLSDLVNNTTIIGEMLPTQARAMDFRVTVRDNRAVGGGVNTDDMVVNVIATAGPFQVTAPNGGEVLDNLTTVTWNRANTQNAPINTSQVNIKLSVDGGFTYPFTLASNTPNDGSEAVGLPVIATTTARIKVEAVNNIYFDISNANFTIAPTGATGTLLGNFIELPVDIGRLPGRALAGNNSQGGKFNPNGTGGAGGRDYWIHGIPVYNYTLYANGQLVMRNGIAPTGQRATAVLSKQGDVNVGTITMPAVNGIQFARRISFQDSDKVVTVVDTVTNSSSEGLTSCWTLDTLDPDQGVPDGLGCFTFNDVVNLGSGTNPLNPDVVMASMPADGFTVGFGSRSPNARVSADGLPNNPRFDPSQVLFSPRDPNNALDDVCINIAGNFGALSPNTSGTITWQLFFGASRQEAADNYTAEVNAGAFGFTNTQLLSFGDQDVNSGGTTRTFTLTHVGANSLVFVGAGMRIAGNDQSQYRLINPNLSPLSGGASRDYPVEFDPNTVGLKNAHVEIFTNDLIEPVLNVNLNGRGVSTGTLNIVKPNGKEVFSRGGFMDISWSPNAGVVGANVGLQLRQGANLTPIIASTENDGDFTFMVPVMQALSPNYRLEITPANTPGTILDFSTNFFQITQSPSLTVTKPLGGDVLVNNQLTSITWTNNNIAAAPITEVDVDLLKNGALFRQLNPANANTSGVLWNVGQVGGAIPEGSDYQIRVRINATPELEALSGFFTVLPQPDIFVTAPCNHAAVVQGGTLNVTWLAVGNVGNQVNVELWRGGVLFQTIAANQPTSPGMFVFNVPGNLALRADYFIRVVSTTNAQFEGRSSLFQIVPQATIQVASPNGGELFVRGQTYDINWQNFVNASEHVRIGLLKGGAVNTVLHPEWPIPNPFRWQVPAGQALGTDYRIRITLLSNPGVTDDSDQDFEIGDARPWYFAEGGTTGSDSTFLLMVNASTSDTANVQITVYFEDPAAPATFNRMIGPRSRDTVNMGGLVGANRRFGMSVRSLNGIEVFAERAMYANPANIFRGSGADSVPSAELGTSWFLAEGTTTGGRETLIAIANPGNMASNVDVTFLRQGNPPVVNSLVVGAGKRVSVIASSIVPNTNFSTKVDSTNGVPVVVERTMRGTANTATETIVDKWSHAALGVNTPSPVWFFAEGAVHSTFDTFCLLGNNTGTNANVTLQFLLSNGSVVNQNVVVPANERFTVNVENDVAGMTDQAGFSIVARSTNGVPIIAERAMFFRSGAFINRSGAHAVVGIPVPKTRWFLPEGAVGGSSQFEAFILAGNDPGNAAAQATFTFIRTAGNAPVVVGPLTINPGQRVTVKANDHLPAGGTQSFSTVVESTNGVPIVVERAMYWSRTDLPVPRIEGHASSGFFVP